MIIVQTVCVIYKESVIHCYNQFSNDKYQYKAYCISAKYYQFIVFTCCNNYKYGNKIEPASWQDLVKTNIHKAYNLLYKAFNQFLKAEYGKF